MRLGVYWVGFGVFLGGWLLACDTRAGMDCSRANGDIEREICGNPDVLAADATVQQLYEKAAAARGADTAALRREQLRWLSYRNRRCGGEPLVGLGISIRPGGRDWRAECLLDSYRERERAFGAAESKNDLCHELAGQLALSHVPSDVSGAAALPVWTGRLIALDPGSKDGLSSDATSHGLTLQSSIEGTVREQDYTIFDTSNGGRRKIERPDGWKRGDDYVHLAEFRGGAFLLRESGSDDYDLTRYAGGGWSAQCTMTVAARADYAVEGGKHGGVCDGNDCDMMQAEGHRLAVVASTPWGRQSLRRAEPPAAYQSKWREMKRLAFDQLSDVEIVIEDGWNERFFDLQLTALPDSNGSNSVGGSTAFVPVLSHGELRLGIVGPAGRGCCSVEDTELFAVYKLAGGTLSLVDGFGFNPHFLVDWAQVSLRTAKDVGEVPGR